MEKDRYQKKAREDLKDLLKRMNENDHSLTYIHLHYLDTDEAASLALALAHNTTVHHLDLSGIPSCDIGDDGAAALAPFLRTNAHLKNLLLTDNKIGPKGAASLAESLVDNTALVFLDLYGNDIGGDDEGATPCSVFAKALAHQRAALSRFNLRETNIGNAGAIALSSGIANNRTLKELNLDANNIGPKGASLLADAISRNDVLEKLSLFGNVVGDEGARVLAKAIGTNQSIQSLQLGSNGIGNEGAKSLAKGFRSNRSIEVIGLSFNNIGDDGARDLATNICHSPTIKEIRLGNNNISSRALQVDCVGVKYWREIDKCQNLIEALIRINCGGVNLHLNDVGFGPEDAVALSVALSRNGTVKKVDLDNNCIGDRGGVALAEVLSQNETIEVLLLRHNGIGNDGAMALASALRNNSVVRTLRLRDNNFGNEALYAFANSLLCNHTIVRLVLRARGGKNCISKEVKRNMGLVKYYVGANVYQREVKVATSAVLKDDVTEFLLPTALARICRDLNISFSLFRKMPHLLTMSNQCS